MSIGIDSNEIKITKFSNDYFEVVSNNWQKLEKKICNDNMFLSWDWMQNVLSQNIEKSYVVELFQNLELVAICIIGVSDGLIRRGYLNKTGNSDIDQVWIEHNDILASKNTLAEFRHLIIDHILNSPLLNIQSLDLDMTASGLTEGLKEKQMINTAQSPGFIKELDSIICKESLLNTLSKNSRSQLKRSIKNLEKNGSLNVEFLSNEQQKQHALDEIAKRHKVQWRQSEWGSGFDNPCFCDFHHQLIKSKNTLISCLKQNGNVLAYGYYFVLNTRVSFYLSAIQKHQDNNIKVGLIFHSLTMLKFANLGITKYDFLAGDARYKRSLSDQEYTLQSSRLYKKNLLGSVEYLLRKLKRKFI